MIGLRVTSRIACLASLMCALVSPGTADSQETKKEKQHRKQAKKQAEAAEKQTVNAAKQAEKLSDSAQIRRIVSVLEMANRNYDGHRAKAIAELKKAANILEQSIQHKGSTNQKGQVAKNESLSKAIHGAAKHTKAVHESQIASDVQLNEAGKRLLEVHAVLLKNGHPQALQHVDEAIKELRIALIIR